MRFWIGTSIFLLLFAVAPIVIEFFSGSPLSLEKREEVSWVRLAQLDYSSGHYPESLGAVNGKPVKIPGFMVPLEDNQAKVSEFLLVPDPQSCIHVPPPPPNQMVMVKMKHPAPVAWRAIWVFGTLKIASSESPYGKVSFTLEAEGVEPYDF